MGKGRTPCCEKESVKKGPWSQHEDLKLISFIQRHGHSNWRSLPKLAGLARCGKSCRLRWVNYLRPEVKRGSLSPDEEETIIRLQSILGNKWSKIASHLPGRTDNEIKNLWNTHLKKRSAATKSSTTKSDDRDNEATLRCDDLHGDAGMSSYEEPSLVDLWNSLLLDEASGSQHDQLSDGIQIQSSSMATNEVVDEKRSESNHQPQTSTSNDGTLKMDSNMKSYLEIMAWPSSPTDYSFPGY